jgi:hypothetical protein
MGYGVSSGYVVGCGWVVGVLYWKGRVLRADVPTVPDNRPKGISLPSAEANFSDYQATGSLDS